MDGDASKSTGTPSVKVTFSGAVVAKAKAAQAPTASAKRAQRKAAKSRKRTAAESEDQAYVNEEEELLEEELELEAEQQPIVLTDSEGEAAAPAKAARQKRAKRPQRVAATKSKRRKGADPADEEEFFDEKAELEEESDEDTGTFRLGQADEEFHDYSGLVLKDDAQNRPLWVCPDGRIFLETHSPVYKQASDFLIAISEPVCRPECMHEYSLTPHSLYAAVSVGLQTDAIVAVLNKLSKVALPNDIKRFIRDSTSNYGKVKLVLQHNKFYVESPDPAILRQLLRDPVIQEARVHSEGSPDLQMRKALRDRVAQQLGEAESIDLTGAGDDAIFADCGPDEEAGPQEDPDSQLHAFEIRGESVEHVKARCLPGGLNYPMLEEYDFKNDNMNPPLAIDLKPTVQHRPFQARSMSKMFGNGRARSGIIVLPCGAGKTLVGVSAASRIKKSCLVLCTNSVSVDQWRYQFTLWSTLQQDQVTRFTSSQREVLSNAAHVCVTTYSMIAFTGRRNEETQRIMDQIQSREWGLLLLDEVHVVPAAMFRKVVGIIHAHTKLGLTATLVREDDRISDLNFLIGPKLYEANWLDLTRDGHIANVQCAEVWCSMTREFMREYLRADSATLKQNLYVMNPTKFQACQFLIQFHEQNRGDKIIVFSDNIFGLRRYAIMLNKPFIYGGTSHAERTRILHAFKHNPQINTLLLSKVGDNSIDIPEANVLIQISSHAGSRRQEAQRLGRILRAKKAKPGARVGAGDYDAFFYTLVSKDTQEMFYSTKRQQFLIDQGYAFKVITNLLDSADRQQFMFSSEEDQRNLLAQVLVESEGEAEEVDDVTDDVGSARPAVRRKAGRLADMSAPGGLVYMEYSTGGRGRGRGSRGGQRKTQHSAIFKKAMR